MIFTLNAFNQVCGTEMKQLSASVVNKISSAQIITSVVSIIKELVENSLDAGCTKINIKLEEYGLDKIEVEDDGCGIKNADAEFIALAHYTSKIASLSDLETLKAYGFRGEALNSLCSVSDVIITTKTSDAQVAVTYVYDHHGKITSSKPAAACTGTIVTVTNLFKNLPVRRQYYKNQSKRKEELKQVEHLLFAYGIAHPKLRTALHHNRCQIWLKNSYPDSYNTISYILGSTFSRSLKRTVVHDANKNIKIEAYLPLMENRETVILNADKRFIIVNNRPVKIQEFDKLIKNTLMKLEDKEMKKQSKYPYILLITLSPADIDVNVEPNKTKLFFRFKNEIIALLSSLLMEMYGSETISNSCFESQLTDNTVDMIDSDEFEESCNTSWLQTQEKFSNSITDNNKIENNISTFKKYEIKDKIHNQKQKNATSSVSDKNLTNHVSVRVNEKENQHSAHGIYLDNNSVTDHTNLEHLVPLINNDIITEQIAEKDNEYLLTENTLSLENIEQIRTSENSLPIDSDQWSKGQLKDQNQQNLEPVTLLTNNMIKTVTKGKNDSKISNNQKVKNSVNSTPQIYQTLLDKWNKNQDQLKKRKLLDKKEKSQLLIKPLQPKSSKINELKKDKPQRIKEITIPFNLSDINLFHVSKKSISSELKFTPVGQLPNGAWICKENQDLGLWNHYRAKEILIFTNLMAKHKIPFKNLDSPIEVTASAVGGYKQWKLLTNLPIQPGVPSYYEYIIDQRIIMNGIQVKKWYDDSIHSLRLEITGLADQLPFYGLLDLKNIINKILENPEISISESRPLKVINYLKSEAVRLVRSIPSGTNKNEIIDLYKKNCNLEKALEDYKCIHNKPVFLSFYKLDKLNTNV